MFLLRRSRTVVFQQHYSSVRAGSSKVVVTAALNGVFTDPKKFQIPVTPKEMADEAEAAYNEGASVVHIHFRDQRTGKGHLPSWEPEIAKTVVDAIRARVPQLLINFTTGTIGHSGPLGGGKLGPCDGPISCLEAGQPDIAALNSGSLNYLRTRKDGTWAWPPITFDNSVPKIQTMLNAMNERGIVPECECFDSGIVRSIRMFMANGLLRPPFSVSLVMGVASGMPCDPEWLPLLIKELPEATPWQVIAIGRTEVWPLLRRAAELGGNVRSGLEDTFYLPDGSRAQSSGQLIHALVDTVRDVGREPMTTEEARSYLLSAEQSCLQSGSETRTD